MADTNPQFENPWYSRREWGIHLVILFLLMGSNLYLANFVSPQMLSLGGLAAESPNMWIPSLMHVLVSFNVMGFAMGNFLALIPFGGQPYAFRYGKLSYISMILVQLGFCIYGISIAIR
jgi:hypothetical protein